MGLNLLEFGSESELSGEENSSVIILIPDPVLTEAYQLPQLFPASSYDELAPKILAVAEQWSSPSHTKAQ
jgi:hypothetical protein